MRHYLKALVIASASLYTALSLIPTIKFGHDPRNILFTIGGLFFISQIISPLFSLILLPINHLTFGIVMLILNVGLIFSLIKLLPGFIVSPYNFPGANIYGLVLPSANFNTLSTIILVAAVITFVQKLLHLIFE